jgi:hypothetical protein
VKATGRQAVLQALFEAVDAVNAQLPRGRRLPRAADTALVGDGSPLDSLGLVTLIVAAEEKMEEAFGVSLTLVDEATRPAEESPFLTLSTLADHLLGRLEGRDA